MDVREAVHAAKQWIGDLYKDEEITNVGLEEVKIEQDSDVWRITIGFSRPWDFRNNLLSPVGAATIRTFKVVFVDDSTGRVTGMESRETSIA